MQADGLIAEIERHFGLAGLELYAAAAGGRQVDAKTPLARDLTTLLRARNSNSPERVRVLEVLLEAVRCAS